MGPSPAADTHSGVLLYLMPLQRLPNLLRVLCLAAAKGAWKANRVCAGKDWCCALDNVLLHMLQDWRHACNDLAFCD
jgi:hypothetical protein